MTKIPEKLSARDDNRMRGLTVQQPYASAIIELRKLVENRSKKPPAAVMGKRIAIHAGHKPDLDGARWMAVSKHISSEWIDSRLEQRGAILGTALLIGYCEKVEDIDTLPGPTNPDVHWIKRHNSLIKMRFTFHHSVLTSVRRDPSIVWDWGWLELERQYGLLLMDVHALPEPIPRPGQLGFWRVSDVAIDKIRWAGSPQPVAR